MKKKLMMVTLLLAGLTMGACVDDKESASVTAVREAKTEQLEALAAMNAAAAEARQAMAAAEAALTKAEAEAAQAAAELKQADAEIQKKQAELNALQNEKKSLENQKLQATLEKELAALEVHKKQIEKDLADIDAQMQQQAILAQKALVQAQQDLVLAEMWMVNYEKQLAVAKTQEEKERLEAEQRELKRLSQAYVEAVDDLNSAKEALLYLRRNLVNAENRLASLEAGKDPLIADTKNKIATKEMQLAKYKEYVNYTEDLEALKASYNKLQGDYDLAYDNSRAALNHWLENVETPETDTLYLEISNDKFYQFAINRYYEIDEEGNTASVQYPLNTYLPYVYSSTKGVVYSYEDENISSVTANIGDSLYCTEPEFNADIRLVEFKVNEQLDRLTLWLENDQKTLKEYQNAYDGNATKGMWPYSVMVTDDQGNLVPSDEACANIKDSIASLKKKYEEATDPTEKSNLRNNYNTFVGYETTALNQIDSYTSSVEYYTSSISLLKEQWEMYQKYDESMAALKKKFDARNKKQLEELAGKVDAWYAWQKAESALKAVKAERDAVAMLLNGQRITDAENNPNEQLGAEALAAAIKKLEDEIAELKESLEDFSNITSQEELVEQIKVQIDAQEAKIKVYEMAVENAKADLEAAMAKAAGTETEE